MICPTKIRPFRPVNDTELQCEVTDSTDSHWRHNAVVRDYAYPGSATEMVWERTDRRCFTGEFIECPVKGCILPAGHHGKDAF